MKFVNHLSRGIRSEVADSAKPRKRPMHPQSGTTSNWLDWATIFLTSYPWRCNKSRTIQTDFQSWKQRNPNSYDVVGSLDFRT